MARSKKGAGEQLGLELGERRTRRVEGRVERRVRASIDAAKRATPPALAATDDGLCVLALELAATVDGCSMTADKPQPYALVGAAGQLRETLDRLGLAPATTTETRDSFDQFLEDAAAAEREAIARARAAGAEGGHPPAS